MQSSAELQTQDYTSDYYNYYNQRRHNKITKPKVYFDFHKTKMCPYLESEACPNGPQCTFAHSASELREMPKLEKTRLCEAYLQVGTCTDGKNCRYAHGEKELKSTSDLYKTSMCYAFLQGNCTAGEHCRYAHGEEELRMPPADRMRYQPAQRPKYYSQQNWENHGYGDDNKRYPLSAYQIYYSQPAMFYPPNTLKYNFPENNQYSATTKTGDQDKEDMELTPVKLNKNGIISQAETEVETSSQCSKDRKEDSEETDSIGNTA